MRPLDIMCDSFDEEDETRDLKERVELLPCPMCGCRPQVYIDDAFDFLVEGVRCSECWQVDVKSHQEQGRSKRLWNTRAKTKREQELTDQNTKLVEALKHCKKIFLSQTERGYYPEEVLPDSEHFQGIQGIGFIDKAIKNKKK